MKKFNIFYLPILVVVVVALGYVGLVQNILALFFVPVIFMMTAPVLFNMVFKSQVKKLRAELNSENFIANHSFTSNSAFIAIDNVNGKIALKFKYNPFKSYYFDISAVTGACVNDFKRGRGIFEGSQCVAFEFRLDGKKLRFYTFFSNKKYVMDSEEILTGIAKAEAVVESLQIGKTGSK